MTREREREREKKEQWKFNTQTHHKNCEKYFCLSVLKVIIVSVHAGKLTTVEHLNQNQVLKSSQRISCIIFSDIFKDTHCSC